MKVRQKIADQMRQQVSQVTVDANGAMQDLNSLIESMGGRESSPSVTRSRFTHAKTLQFAQVNIVCHSYLSNFFNVELRFVFLATHYVAHRRRL